jgi:hypothetical protein
MEEVVVEKVVEEEMEEVRNARCGRAKHVE